MIITILFCVVSYSERENTWALRVRDCSLSSLIPLERIKIFGGNRKIANINFIPSKRIKLGLRLGVRNVEGREKGQENNIYGGKWFLGADFW